MYPRVRFATLGFGVKRLRRSADSAATYGKRREQNQFDMIELGVHIPSGPKSANSSYSGCCAVFEAREFVQPGELDVAGGAVALLADQEVGLAFHALAVFFVRLIELFAVDEHHDVGVLLDRARLAQVAELRLVVARGFDLAIELGEAEHGHVQLAGQALQAARDAGDLLLPRIARVVGLDQLQVVDDDQRQARPAA